MQSGLEKDLSFFKIWFPPINLWNHPYQHRFDRTVFFGIDMPELDDLGRQLNLFEAWVRNQTDFNPDLLMAISRPDDALLLFAVPTSASKGLFIVFEPVTDKHALALLENQGYDVARCKTWSAARQAILKYSN